MKRVIFLITMALCVSLIAFGQDEAKDEFKPSGKAFGKIFWNYHLNLTKDASQVHTFQLQRAYFGYKYAMTEDISLKITLDGARNSAASAYTVFLKHAQLDWKLNSTVKLSMGVIGLKQFDTQEKFWGYRYIYKDFQDEFGLGTSADLGVNAEIKLADNLKANVFLLNGQGYTRIQDNEGRLKFGGNLVYEVKEGLTLKAYYDIYGGKYPDANDVATDTASIHTLTFFAGYRVKQFRIGGSYNLQLNGTSYYRIADAHDLSGFSLFGTYVINDKFELFANWLNFQSSTLEGETNPWNYDEDGNVVVAGVQYKPAKGLLMALNYRTYLFDNSALTNESLIYLNCQFAF